MSQNKNIFNDIAPPKVQKSSFDLGDTHVTAMNFGELVPVYVKPTLPGSHWSMSSEWLVKTSAMLAPVMHRNQVYIHTFYVPYRLLWENWVDFITETKTLGVLPAVPYITMMPNETNPVAFGYIGRLANYLGVPLPASVPGFDTDEKVQAFWFSAYQFIWSEYYRDENLQAEADYQLVDGDNAALFASITPLRLRAWMHDYFTSALPDTQKGAAVNIPMSFPDVPVFRDLAGGGFTTATAAPSNILIPNIQSPDIEGDALYVEGSNFVGNASIIDLRTAEQLQKFRETMMTHGSRYNEFLQAIYGYKIADSTIQRPVYLGGMRADLVISETLNTAGNEALDLPQGNKSGNANSYGNGGQISYTCPEHGVIMSIMSVMPDSMYFQGIPKEMQKLDDPFEFGNPLMANIGEQRIEYNEIFAYQPSSGQPFGYQMRYAEYKQSYSRISSDMATSLLFWNEARKFSTQPSLNSDFIVCNHANDGLSRIFNVEDSAVQKLWVMIRTNATVAQPLPYFGTPKLGD